MTRAILWDFDQTLAHRPGRWTGVLLELLEAEDPEHGISRDLLRTSMRDGLPWHRPEEPHHHLDSDDAWWDHVTEALVRAYMRAGVAEDLSRRLAPGFRARYADPGGFHLYPDTRPALERLRAAGWRHVILSNHVPELEAIVAHLGLDGLVERVLTSARLGIEKPHPEAFLAGIVATGGAETIVMVGDNHDADVRGAESVGLPAVLVRGTHEEARWSAPDLHRAAALIETHFAGD